MIISVHACREMEKAGISEDEVMECLNHGSLEIRQIVNGETRYGKKLELKEKTIMVIYTIRNDDERVITAYTIRRKNKWEKK